MKRFFLNFLFVLATPVVAQSIFIPERGDYDYGIKEIEQSMKAAKLNYVYSKNLGNSARYKLDKKRNEYQIKDWYQQNWYSLQDQFFFDHQSFIDKEHSLTFNGAKRQQYSGFAFDDKKFFHWKSAPSMKEWGGLTHPPVRKLTLPLKAYDLNFGKINYSAISSPYFNPVFQKEIDLVSKSELTFTNEVRALADNKAFAKKMQLISKAKDSILMSSLVFVCDKSTRQLINLLIEKYQQGVDVKILADGFISKSLGHTECLGIMREAGIEVVESNDFFKHEQKAIYHTKTLITDFREAVAGGHNMIDADNLSRGVDFKNRDIDLYIKGPMVTDIVKQFVENWRYQGQIRSHLTPLLKYEKMVKIQLELEKKQGLRGAPFYNLVLGNPATRMKGVCRFIKQAPYEDRHTIGKAYLKLLEKVSKHLVITDPIKGDSLVTNRKQGRFSEYMTNYEMYDRLHHKIHSMIISGLKIDYITTNINMAGNENVAMMNERIKEQLFLNQNIAANTSLAFLEASNLYYGRPHYKNLLKDWAPYPNVHVWNHISFMHSKIFYFDRVVSSVGSYNFNHNATDQSYESTAICMDEGLNNELDEMLVEDMVNSIPLIFSELR